MVKVVLELVQYRDAGMMSFTYFWTIDTRHVGPFFDSESEAKDWLNKRLAI